MRRCGRLRTLVGSCLSALRFGGYISASIGASIGPLLLGIKGAIVPAGPLHRGVIHEAVRIIVLARCAGASPGLILGLILWLILGLIIWGSGAGRFKAAAADQQIARIIIGLRGRRNFEIKRFIVAWRWRRFFLGARLLGLLCGLLLNGLLWSGCLLCRGLLLLGLRRRGLLLLGLRRGGRLRACLSAGCGRARVRRGAGRRLCGP